MTTEATHAPSAKTNHGASSWGWLTVFALTFWPAFLYFLGRRLGWAKPWRWVAAFAPVALVIIIIAAGGGSSGDTPSATPAPASAPASAPAAAANPPTPPPPPAAKAPSETVSQENARKSAESYLGFQAFSRQGLIQQLSSSAGEGFSRADALYAVDHIDVDWSEQAARAAKQYLGEQSFSRAGLIQQLESSAGEGFTHAQAVYGVDQTGL
jgi:host cell surface-exposed lipoprotein